MSSTESSSQCSTTPLGPRASGSSVSRLADPGIDRGVGGADLVVKRRLVAMNVAGDVALEADVHAGELVAVAFAAFGRRGGWRWAMPQRAAGRPAARCQQVGRAAADADQPARPAGPQPAVRMLTRQVGAPPSDSARAVAALLRIERNSFPWRRRRRQTISSICWSVLLHLGFGEADRLLKLHFHDLGPQPMRGIGGHDRLLEHGLAAVEVHLPLPIDLQVAGRLPAAGPPCRGPPALPCGPGRRSRGGWRRGRGSGSSRSATGRGPRNGPAGRAPWPCASGRLASAHLQPVAGDQQRLLVRPGRPRLAEGRTSVVPRSAIRQFGLASGPPTAGPPPAAGGR